MKKINCINTQTFTVACTDSSISFHTYNLSTNFSTTTQEIPISFVHILYTSNSIIQSNNKIYIYFDP